MFDRVILWPLRSAFIGWSAGVLLIVVITAVLMFAKAIRMRPLHNGIAVEMAAREQFVTHPLWLLVFAGLEEAFARAFLIGWLSHYTGLLIAFVVSAAVFAVLHVPNGRQTMVSMLNLVLVTVLFGIIFVRFGLWAAIGIHYGWNLMQWPILGYPMYGRQVGRWFSIRASDPEWISGGDFGPEYSMVASVLLAVGIAVAATLR